MEQQFCSGNFKGKLKEKMNSYVHVIYRLTKKFPREELYSSVSQLRRAALSVVLNYIEGYARRRPAVQLHFLEIAYGSLKESEYLLDFSFEEKYLSEDEFTGIKKNADEIGAMLWTELSSLRNSIE